MPDQSRDSSRRQVLIRLSDSQFEMLSAYAYLRGTTGTDVARSQVAQFLDRVGADERVQRVVRERREFDAEEAGTLSRMRGAGSKGRSKS